VQIPTKINGFAYSFFGCGVPERGRRRSGANLNMKTHLKIRKTQAEALAADHSRLSDGAYRLPTNF
jgi:hypothetical protein